MKTDFFWLYCFTSSLPFISKLLGSAVYIPSPTPFLLSPPPPNIMKAFKHTAKLKELYHEHAFSHHLNYTINNMDLITYLSPQLSIISPSINLYYFLMHFELKDISPLLLNTSAHILLPINISCSVLFCCGIYTTTTVSIPSKFSPAPFPLCPLTSCTTPNTLLLPPRHWT